MSVSRKTDQMELKHAAAAGLDVHKMKITASVRTCSADHEVSSETKEFGALASGLADLVAWLKERDVTGAVMEATGVYWETVYDAVCEAGIETHVVNAQHVKQLKGRKSDVADSLWLARICQYGLACPSLVLPKAFRDLRGLSRYRRSVVEQRAQIQLRIQKVLDRNGIRIGGILSRAVTGMNGRRIIEGLIAGETRETILSLLSYHVRRRLNELGDALSVELDEHSRWIVADLLEQFDAATARIDRIDARIAESLTEYEAIIQLLETVPGINRVSAMAILIELGPAMSVFPSARHCAAWAGICPGNNESAGKRRSGRLRRGNATLRAVLVECAHAAVRTRDCQFRSYHESLKCRIGYKRSVVAVAHKQLRTMFAMMRDGRAYQDPGIDYEEISIGRRAPRWLQKLAKYGHVQAAPPPASADAQAA